MSTHQKRRDFVRAMFPHLFVRPNEWGEPPFGRYFRTLAQAGVDARTFTRTPVDPQRLRTDFAQRVIAGFSGAKPIVVKADAQAAQPPRHQER